MKSKASITGRDGFVIAKALAYAVEAIDRLPERWQEDSDRADMLAVLTASVGHAEACYFRMQARAHLQQRAIEVRNGGLALRERPQDGNVVHLQQ